MAADLSLVEFLKKQIEELTKDKQKLENENGELLDKVVKTSEDLALAVELNKTEQDLLAALKDRNKDKVQEEAAKHDAVMKNGLVGLAVVTPDPAVLELERVRKELEGEKQARALAETKIKEEADRQQKEQEERTLRAKKDAEDAKAKKAAEDVAREQEARARAAAEAQSHVSRIINAMIRQGF